MSYFSMHLWSFTVNDEIPRLFRDDLVDSEAEPGIVLPIRFGYEPAHLVVDRVDQARALEQ